MLGMAGLFGFLGAFMFWRCYKRQTKGCVAEGIVVSHQERRHSDGTTYRPEVEFRTRDGEHITFVASTGSSRRPTPGRKVKVLYYPADPEDADIASFGTFWVIPLLLMAFAAGFLTLSVNCFSRIP